MFAIQFKKSGLFLGKGSEAVDQKKDALLWDNAFDADTYARMNMVYGTYRIVRV